MDELRRQFEAVKDAFDELAEQLRAHMHSFGAWLVEVGQAYLRGIGPVGIQDIVAENRRLKFELDTLRAVLKRQEELVVEQLRELELLAEQFAHLGSLQKVAALGDFLPRLRVLVDKFGAVVEARRVTPALEMPGPGADAPQPSPSAPPRPRRGPGVFAAKPAKAAGARLPRPAAGPSDPGRPAHPCRARGGRLPELPTRPEAIRAQRAGHRPRNLHPPLAGYRRGAKWDPAASGAKRSDRAAGRPGAGKEHPHPAVDAGPGEEDFRTGYGSHTRVRRGARGCGDKP